MKVILVMVSSINGKTTKGEASGTSGFASKEDQDYFFQTLRENKLLIMGSKTYEVARPEMKLSPVRLRVVLTSRPDRFQSDVIKGQLEFSSDDPRKLLSKLEDRGYTQALLLGGARTNSQFLKENLVSELWLTVEPKIFGTGNNLLDEVGLDLNLQLINFEQLNAEGTLLLKYRLNSVSHQM